MKVEIRAVSYVVTLLLQPESHWMLPEKVLARSQRKRRIHELTVLCVRPVKADANVRTDLPDVDGPIVVKRVSARPLIIGLPGEITYLAQEIRLSMFLDDKYRIALRTERLIPAQLS